MHSWYHRYRRKDRHLAVPFLTHSTEKTVQPFSKSVVSWRPEETLCGLHEEASLLHCHSSWPWIPKQEIVLVTLITVTTLEHSLFPAVGKVCVSSYCGQLLVRGLFSNWALTSKALLLTTML